MSGLAACTVYFDGACPLCRREIAHYRRREGAGSINWIDAASCDPAALGADLTREAALARLHVRRADGSLVSGAAAFAAIWNQLPAYGWVAVLASRRWLLTLMEAVYKGFLRLRPLWRRAEAAAAPPAVEALADVQGDYAREAGALALCRGVLAAAGDGESRAEAAHHLAAGHLRLLRLRRWLPAEPGHRLLPLWRATGWLVGVATALAGPRAVRATVAAVEHRLDRRFAERIERISTHVELAEFGATRAACRRRDASNSDTAAPPDAASRAPACGWSVIAGGQVELRVPARLKRGLDPLLPSPR